MVTHAGIEKPEFRVSVSRGVFRVGEIPTQVFIECQLRAAYMRPLQVNRKRDMASGCGPGMPGPYRVAMGK